MNDTTPRDGNVEGPLEEGPVAGVAERQIRTDDNTLDLERDGTSDASVGGREIKGRSLTADAVEPTDESRKSPDGEMKPGEINTVDGLLRYAYDQAGKRFTIPGAVFKVLAAQRELDPDGHDPARALVLELATGDPLLAVPPRILVAVDEAQTGAALRRRLVDTIVMALRQHPVFRGEVLQSALTARPDDREDVFRAVHHAVAHVTASELGLGTREVKSSDRDKLLSNAITALAMSMALRDRWSIDELIVCLYEHLWTQELAKTPSRSPRALVADSRTPDALGWAARVFDARAHRAESRANDAESRAENAMHRAFAADSMISERDRQLDDRINEIDELRRRIEALDRSVEAERRDRVVDRSHHIDDYETLRTRITRMLDTQTELLSDGLHALRNGSTGVTEEFLERAISAFGRELVQLKTQEEDR